MQRFYRTIKIAISDLYFWSWDYLYVTYWQLRGFWRRDNAQKYIRSRSSKGTIVVIPGVYERWQFMKPIVEVLYEQGYSVHVVESLGYNTGLVEEMAERIQDHVRSLHLECYSIVAHSKGGLIAKRLLASESAAIERVVTINTPYNGSVYAKLFPFKSIRVFMPASALITLLAKDVASNKKITSIYSAFDPHIPGGSFLDGATNRRIATGGHFRILGDVRLHAVLLRSLES